MATTFSLHCKHESILPQADTFKDLVCTQTPPDQEGPYHREGMPQRSNLRIHREQAIPFQLRGQILLPNDSNR